MSLSVQAYTIDRNTGRYECSLGTGDHTQMAGGENWRSQVYGSAAAKSLGLTLLPSLDEPGTSYWQGEEQLDRLECEARILLNNLDFMAEQTMLDSSGKCN